MSQKKVGNSVNSIVQGDALKLNYGLTATVQFSFTGSNSLTFSLPQDYGSAGWGIITDGNGNLSFGTVSTNQLLSGSGTTPSLTKWSGSYSITDSILQEVGNQILFQGGLTSAPSISFQSDTDTGIYKAGLNKVGIVTGAYLVQSFASDEVYHTLSNGAQIYHSSGSGISLYDPTNGVAITGSVSIANIGPNQWVYTDSNGTLISSGTALGVTGATGPRIVAGWVSNGVLSFTMSDGVTFSVVGYIIGATGATGAQGVQGIQGVTGATGANGTNGSTGATGATGATGVGISSAVVQNQYLIVTYTNGSTANAGWIVGPTGATGAQGIQGNTGPTGSVGATGPGLGLSTPITLTDAATVSWNYTLGFNAQVTLTGNRNISITGVTAGDYGTLLIIQGGAGSFRLNFTASHKFPNATYSFTTTVGQADMYGFYYNGTNFYWQYANNY